VAILQFFMRVLEVLFFLGVAGSLVVVVWTMIEDLGLMVSGRTRGDSR